MKRRWLAGGTIALLLITLGGCGSTRSLLGQLGQKPEITGVHPRITGLDLSGVNLAFELDVANPYSVPIHSPNFKYALDISGSQFAESSETAAVDLPARKTGTVTLPLRVGYADLRKTYNNLKGAKEIPYTLRGALVLPVAGESVELPVKKSGSFPVLHLPHVSGIRPSLSNVGLGGGTLDVKANFTNPNAFALGLQSLGYAVKLGDVELGSVTASTLGSVAAGETREVDLSGNLSAGNLTQVLGGTRLGQIQLEATGTLETPYGKVPLPR